MQNGNPAYEKTRPNQKWGPRLPHGTFKGGAGVTAVVSDSADGLSGTFKEEKQRSNRKGVTQDRWQGVSLFLRGDFAAAGSAFGKKKKKFWRKEVLNHTVRDP